MNLVISLHFIWWLYMVWHFNYFGSFIINIQNFAFLVNINKPKLNNNKQTKPTYVEKVHCIDYLTHYEHLASTGLYEQFMLEGEKSKYRKEKHQILRKVMRFWLYFKNIVCVCVVEGVFEALALVSLK